MNRERIYDGIIVSAKPFSSDAKVEFQRHNREGALRLRHILIEDLLAGDINLDFELTKGGSFRENFIETIRDFIKEN